MISDTDPQPFGLVRAKRALGYFAVGKVLGAALGIVWLVLLARLLPTSDYAGYVTLVAALEVILLLTSLGAYPIAQRYISEAAMPKNASQLFAIFWGSAVYRLLTLLAAGAGLVAWGPEMFGWLGVTTAMALIQIYAIVIICEGTARIFDLMFESLLMQGTAQICALSRSGLRLTTCIFFVFAAEEIGLRDIVLAEVLASTIGLGISIVLATRRVVRRNSDSDFSGDAKAITASRMFAFAAPWTLAQMITQIYSPDAVKFLVAKVLGVVEVAAFGLAHSLSMVLQRYLPAQLLIGWLRPQIIARFGDRARLRDMMFSANLILKANHFLIAPVIALVFVESDTIIAFVAGDKMTSAAPMLFGLVLLLIPQALHLVLSMLGAAIEDNHGTLFGTIASIPGVFAGLALSNTWGALGMIAGLWVSELLFCGAAAWFLARRGVPFGIDWTGWGKLFAAAIFSGLLALWCTDSLTGIASILVSGCVIAVSYITACIVLQPFSALERARINQFLPGDWLRF